MKKRKNPLPPRVGDIWQDMHDERSLITDERDDDGEIIYTVLCLDNGKSYDMEYESSWYDDYENAGTPFYHTLVG